MDKVLVAYFIICIIFFLFYFTYLNMFNLLPNSIITDFKKISTAGNPLVSANRYQINYVNNNYLISDNGVLYIDTSTSLLNINFPFVNYVYDIVNDFPTVVPIVKGLKK